MFSELQTSLVVYLTRKTHLTSMFQTGIIVSSKQQMVKAKHCKIVAEVHDHFNQEPIAFFFIS